MMTLMLVHVQLTNRKRNASFRYILAVHRYESTSLKTQSILNFMSQNYAYISGYALYGGLPDRCAVSLLAEVHYKC